MDYAPPLRDPQQGGSSTHLFGHYGRRPGPPFGLERRLAYYDSQKGRVQPQTLSDAIHRIAQAGIVAEIEQAAGIAAEIGIDPPALPPIPTDPYPSVLPPIATIPRERIEAIALAIHPEIPPEAEIEEAGKAEIAAPEIFEEAEIEEPGEAGEELRPIRPARSYRAILLLLLVILSMGVVVRDHLIAQTTSFVEMLKENRGVVAIEAAFIMPVILLMMAGGINYGMGIWTFQRLTMAADSAAQCASVGQCTTPSATESYARDRAGIVGAAFIATEQACGQHVAGQHSYNLISLFPPTPMSVDACRATIH